MLELIEARLENRVPELVHRVKPAGDFSKLMSSGKLPSAGLEAYVLPVGLQGRSANASAGLFSQDIQRSIAVVLMTQSVDATGRRAMNQLSPLVDEIITALIGWAPSDEVGVLELRSGVFLPGGKGMLGYQVDFSINDELKVTP